MPHCGYHRDDWIDVDCDNDGDIFGVTGAKNSRALGEFETEGTDRILEQRGVYRLH